MIGETRRPLTGITSHLLRCPHTNLGTKSPRPRTGVGRAAGGGAGDSDESCEQNEGVGCKGREGSRAREEVQKAVSGTSRRTFDPLTFVRLHSTCKAYLREFALRVKVLGRRGGGRLLLLWALVARRGHRASQ